jgi:hypothetical protein
MSERGKIISIKYYSSLHTWLPINESLTRVCGKKNKKALTKQLQNLIQQLKTGSSVNVNEFGFYDLR